MELDDGLALEEVLGEVFQPPDYLPKVRMAKHFIFVVTDHKEGRRRIAASEVLASRARLAFWTLSSSSRHVKELEEGDLVVFYVGGREGGYFAGRARLASKPYSISDVERRMLLGKPSSAFDLVVDLHDIELWERPRSVFGLKERLSFIREKDRPLSYFRGSIRRISPSDYEVIVAQMGFEDQLTSST